KSTVPLSNTRVPSAARFAVLAALDVKVSFAEKFKPNSAATFGSSTSVKMYQTLDRKSTRLNSSHVSISYAVFCLKKKKKEDKKVGLQVIRAQKLAVAADDGRRGRIVEGERVDLVGAGGDKLVRRARWQGDSTDVN